MRRWTELTRIHLQPSRYYDIDHFKAGGLSLRALQRDEVGDVRGKTLLHLQCHFGLDTLASAVFRQAHRAIEVIDL